MMMDKQFQLASAQLITDSLAAGTRLFTTNAYDLWGDAVATTPRQANEPFGLNAVEIDPAQGEPLYAVFTITTVFSLASTDGTVTFSIGDATAADGTGYVVRASSRAYTEAECVAGLRVVIPLAGQPFALRFLVGSLVSATQAFAGSGAAGNFNCDIVRDVQTIPA